MHWTQVVYMLALCAALYGGGAPVRVAAVMLCNLAFTFTVAAEPIAVGVVDIACAVALIGHNMRANIVALLFALMIPVYVAGLKTSTTYTIVDAIAFLQIGVIWRVDSGIRNARRFIGRLVSCFVRPMVQGGDTKRNLALVSRKDKGMNHGGR